MANSESNLADFSTVETALRSCHKALRDSDVFFGHGTDNPWDEAVQLVLSLNALPLTSGDEVLSRAVAVNIQSQIARLLKTRLEQRIPMP